MRERGISSIGYPTEFQQGSGEKVKEIYGVTTEGEWEKITFTGDSGAVDHVITKETGSAFQVKPTSMSKRGIGFRAANNTVIKNFGVRALEGELEKGERFQMRCQVTDVNKNLASFPKMVEEGNDILLSKKKGSYIINEERGIKIPMRLKRGGTPEFDVWVKKASATGQFGVLNVDGEADIADDKFQTFQRLEQNI